MTPAHLAVPLSGGPTSWPRLLSVGVRAWGCGERAAGPAYPSASYCQGPSCPRLRCCPVPWGTSNSAFLSWNPTPLPFACIYFSQVPQLPPLPKRLRPSMAPRAPRVWGLPGGSVFLIFCVLVPGYDPAFQRRTCTFSRPPELSTQLPHARRNADGSLGGHWHF